MMNHNGPNFKMTTGYSPVNSKTLLIGSCVFSELRRGMEREALVTSPRDKSGEAGIENCALWCHWLVFFRRNTTLTRTLTSFSESPLHLLTMDDAEILKKVVLHSVATAFASSVFPVPVEKKNMNFCYGSRIRTLQPNTAKESDGSNTKQPRTTTSAKTTRLITEDKKADICAVLLSNETSNAPTPRCLQT